MIGHLAREVAADLRSRKWPHLVSYGPERVGRDGFKSAVVFMRDREAEEAIVEYLDRLGEGKSLHVKGFWCKDGGSIIKNENRSLIENLDSLPYPDWEIWDMKIYMNSLKNQLKNFMMILLTPKYMIYIKFGLFKIINQGLVLKCIKNYFRH